MAVNSMQPAVSVSESPQKLRYAGHRSLPSQPPFWSSSDHSGDIGLPLISGSLRHSQLQGATSDGKRSGAPHFLQEFLWKQSLCRELWWGYRGRKESLHYGICGHRHSKEFLLPWRPTWVISEVAYVNATLWPPGSKSSLTLQHDARPQRIIVDGSNRAAKTIIKLCDKGQLKEAVEGLGTLVQAQVQIPTSVLCRVLKSCVAHKNLVLGRLVHEFALKSGYESNTFVANHILRMYGAHGKLQEAKDVFTRIAKPDAFTWSAIIAAYAKHGEPKQAIKLYQKMRTSNVKPDCHVFVSVLQACARAADLVSGRQVHADVLNTSVQPDLYVWNCLLELYAKCGKLEDASSIFNSLVTKDVVTWTTMVTLYAEHDRGQEALNLYDQMQVEGVVVADPVTYACLVKACAKIGALHLGKQLHSQIREKGLETNVVVGTCLVDMYSSCGKLDEAREVHDNLVTSDMVTCNVMIAGYAKCGRFGEARKLFDSLTVKDVATWTTMIAGYTQHGLGQEALAIYDRMEQESLVTPNSVTFICLLKACASAGALEQGRQLHSQILRNGLDDDIVVCTSLVNMYVKCGSLDEARQVFDSLATQDVVLWTTMIAGYTDHGLGQEAFALYSRMEGVVAADSFTFAGLLKACATAGSLQQGKRLHLQILERGVNTDTVVGNSLVNMYITFGRIEEARAVFDTMTAKDVVTWNSMIAGYMKDGSLVEARSMFDTLGTKNVETWNTMINGYAHSGKCEEAVFLFEQLEAEGVVQADPATFACLLKACVISGALKQGKQLHARVVECKLEANTMIGNSLVHMYASCGEFEEACRVFDRLEAKNVVTWTSMIAGYAEHGLGQEALALYDSMEQDSSIQPNSITMACLLRACTIIGAVQRGKQLHSKILERGMEAETMIGNCLVDMYAKCGMLEDARTVFDSMPAKDVVTWSIMINGCGQCNEGHRALEYFQEMVEEGIQPNETTFMSVLTACSHEGLVQEGEQLFGAMVEESHIAPTIEHYNCMVDLFGRAGCLEKAEKMLVSCENNEVGLMSLLTACKNHGDVERGMRCFHRLIEINSQSASAYVLMGNICSATGRWEDVQRIEVLRKSAGASKKPAVAGIEVDRHVHTFVVGEERGDISSKVRSTNARLIKEGGHVPHTQLVLKGLSEKEKEDQLCGHAEKLALAYGLLNTPDGTPLVVTKNLRMCDDCHSSTEIMSRIEKREITVRDAHRVHRFVDGSCRCGGRP